MPYIIQADRHKFEAPLLATLQILSASDPSYLKGEYVGFWVNRVVQKYLISPSHTDNSFNSHQFNEAAKKALITAADSASAMLNNNDPLQSAGELNYLLTSLIWGFLGAAKGFSPAGYGLRTYVRGILEKVIDQLPIVQSSSPRDAVIGSRRFLIVKGVLNDVIEETYRRKTAPYEDEKISENSDIWTDGSLS